jgi:hypothetical protein
MVLPLACRLAPWLVHRFLSTHQRRGLAGLLAGSMLVSPMSSPVESRVLHEWLVHEPTPWLVTPVSARVGCHVPDLQ